MDLFGVHFTAEMEKRLDEIEDGRIDWRDMIHDFYPSLIEWIEHAREKTDPDFINNALRALETVTSWNPAIKSGRKTYDDQKTFYELRKKFEKGEQLSKRQGQMLYRICCRYINQLPKEIISELDLIEPEEISQDTRRKLEVLKNVEFDKPKKVGSRTFDDMKFFISLRDQIILGNDLSDVQLKSLDRLIRKYSESWKNWRQSHR